MAELADFETLRNLAARGHFMSFDHIREFDKLNSDRAEFLKLLATEDVYRRTFEFDGKDLLDDFWTFDRDTTATSFALPSTKLLGGAISGNTGATDNGAISMRGPLIYKGDNYCGMHVHWKSDVVTNLQFEIGFIDAVTDATLPVITDVDPPASGNGGADIAVVHMDTDQTLTTMALVADGSTSGMACTKSNIATLAPTAATYQCIRMQLYANHVQVIIDNQRNYWKALRENVEGGTLVMPWLFWRCRSAAAKAIDIDFVDVWGMR